MPRELPAGTVTVLFTDVVGSTALSTGHGDTPAHALLQDQRAIIRKQLQAHDGYEVKTMGDGFMVAFSSARQAVACTIAIQQGLHRRPQTPGVRMGLNTGEVIPEGDDLFGSAVNAAERIMSKAAGGEILISEAVRAVLGAGTEFRFEDRGRMRLKGFPDRVRVFAVDWQPAPTEEESPPSPTSELVGRKRELSRLSEIINAARGGKGATVLISGEPGVGKTRLAEEASAVAAKFGFSALTGRCFEEVGSPPYGPFLEMVNAATNAMPAMSMQFFDSLLDRGEVGPQLGLDHGPVRGLTARSEFAMAFMEFLSASAHQNPLMLILDDLQWADTESTDLLRLLARRCRELPVVIVATYRDDEIDMTSPFARALDELNSKHLAIDMHLSVLAIDDIRAMLSTRSPGHQPPAAMATVLLQASGGNAFYFEELCGYLAEEGKLFDDAGQWRSSVSLEAGEMPRTLRVIIGRRLARLSQPTNAALEVAAVLGMSFDAELLAKVLDVPRDAAFDALEEAERARILTPDVGHPGHRVRFKHPLLRSAIVANLSPTARQRIHARAAKGMERNGETAIAAAELAFHYLEARGFADSARAIAAYRRAAGAALAIYANQSALRHLELAQSMSEEGSAVSARDRADIALRMGQALFRLGEWDRSAEELHRGLALFKEADDRAGQAQVLYAQASLATFKAQPREALELLSRAGDLRPEGALRGLIIQLEAQNLVDMRAYAEAENTVALALKVADALDDADVRNHVRFASGYLAMATLDLERAGREFGHTSTDNLATPHERMAALARHAIAIACTGQLDDAERSAAAARDFFLSMQETAADAERDPYEAGLACVATAAVLVARGRLQGARELLQSAVDQSGSPPNARVLRTLGPSLIQCLLLLGHYGEIDGWLLSVAPASGGRNPALARVVRSLVAIARGDTSTTIEQVPPRSDRPDLLSLTVGIPAMELALASRDEDAVRAHLPGLESLLERDVLFSPTWTVLVPRMVGEAHAVLGGHLRARELLTLALSASERVSATLEVGRSHLAFAELDRAIGDSHGARRHIEAAHKAFETSEVRCFDLRLRSFDEPKDTSDHVDSRLSDEEQDILRLMVAGLSNKAIAEIQGSNDRAVQRQIRTVYNKIGVESRVAAVAYAFRIGLMEQPDRKEGSS